MPEKNKQVAYFQTGYPHLFSFKNNYFLDILFFSLYRLFFFFWLLEWQICKYNFICATNNGFHLHKGFLPPWIQTEMPLALIIASEKIL